MQNIKKIQRTLELLADEEHYIFKISDFAQIFEDMNYPALKALINRAAGSGILKRICKGIYLYDRVNYPRGLILYHTAARLRAGFFNYLSLETVLSEASIISQIPMNWISIMSSGRSNIIKCGSFGTIEFIHTKKTADSIADKIFYDTRSRLWKAKPELALRDVKDTGRPLDLIDWSAADGFL